MRPRLKVIFIALAVFLVFALAGLITSLSSRLDQRRRHRALAQEKAAFAERQAMRKATAIYWQILSQCETDGRAHLDMAIRAALSQEPPLISLEQSLRLNWITTEDYEFLRSQGAVFHPFDWNSSPPETVVMELSRGEFLIAKNGSSGWKRDLTNGFPPVIRNKLIWMGKATR